MEETAVPMDCVTAMQDNEIGNAVQMLQTDNGPVILYGTSPNLQTSSHGAVEETCSQPGQHQTPVLDDSGAQLISEQAGSILHHFVLSKDVKLPAARAQHSDVPAATPNNDLSGASVRDAFHCGLCGDVCCSITDFLIHKSSHIGPGLGLGCEICGTSYTRRVALKEHYKRKHKIFLVQKTELHKSRPVVIVSKNQAQSRNRKQTESLEVQRNGNTCDAIGIAEREVNAVHVELMPLCASSEQNGHPGSQSGVVADNVSELLSPPAVIGNSPADGDDKGDNSGVHTAVATAGVSVTAEMTDSSDINRGLHEDAIQNGTRDKVPGFTMLDFHFILKFDDVQGNGFNYGRHLFKCLYCEFKTYFRNTLCRHMREKHGEILSMQKYLEIKDRPVENGQKVFKMSQYLVLQKDRSKVKRIRGVEKQDMPGNFPCSKCGKVFSRLRYLRKHVHTHTTDKGLLCSECGKSFKTQAYLAQHLKSHQAKEAYHCSQCDFVSEVNSAIHAHRQLHTRGSVLCDVCGFAYTDKSTLNKHKNVHDLSRPFACTYQGCTWRFKSEVMCRAHFRAHTSQGKFVCSHCGYPFRHKHHLQRHERQMHGINPPKSTYQAPPHVEDEQQLTNVKPPDSYIDGDGNNVILNSVEGEEQLELETALQSSQLVIATDEDGNAINYEMSDIAMNVAYQTLLQGQDGNQVDSHTILIPQVDGSHIVFQHEEVTETVGTEEGQEC